MKIDDNEKIAHIVDCDYMFTTGEKSDLANLLIIKANHMKVRLTIEPKDAGLPKGQCSITSFEVK